MQERDNREMAADGAAGDCVFAGEPFRAAAADRTVVREAAVAGGPCRRWNVSPVLSGNTEQEAEK